ncbi:phosphoenolpyruvate carboxykinase (ATP) [Bacteriovoracaceae bacterium]|nr:phosphoenolpyruvate carboxykinase (ATP) [Bacteriovoracaceae bacterium]
MSGQILEKYNLVNKSKLTYNADNAYLIDKAVANKQGTLSGHGALMVDSTPNTGRSAKDKYMVRNATTENTIDWSHDVNTYTEDQFHMVREFALNFFQSYEEEIFVSTRCVGADPKHHLVTNLFTVGPQHNLFFNHMFRPFDEDKYTINIDEQFTVLHLPFEKIDKNKFGTKSDKGVFINLDLKEVIVIGTAYAGEIKKSIFSIMNYILPEKNILPMHSGANIDNKGDVSVFFGLSGTGKTTLSTDEGTKLIGDDEHGLSDSGIFNFENGCYAKTFELKEESEPDIYKACHSFGTMIENVKYDEASKTIDFSDKSITENGRASYPLTAISHIKDDSCGPIPKDIFFLTADAFGVLPPVSKLSYEQSMYYFLSGYTAKLAGTEIGVTEPVATFSTCFGGPFMMRNPNEYAKLLGNYVKKYNINVWLINTGWTGGVYGVGHRFPIKITREIIRAIQAGLPENTEYETEEFFGLNIPTSLAKVENKYLHPMETWANKDDYKAKATDLCQMFNKNFEKYQGLDAEIYEGGPLIK